MTFERVANYRGVILIRYNHMTPAFEWPLLTYITSDGTRIQYHEAEAYGPYAKRGQAKTQIKRELEYRLGRKHIEGIHAFTEETVIEWGGAMHLPIDLHS
jgi:hypothetical protein